jgi:hypothetical protein
MFPPLRHDEKGRIFPLTPEERKARSEAAIRALAAIAKLPDNDPPGIEAEFMRGIDENRGPSRKIFEDLGIYCGDPRDFTVESTVCGRINGSRNLF